MASLSVISMGRGKLLRTKIREEKRLVKARLQAEKEWEERTSNFSHILKKQFMKITAKLSFDDLLAIAVGSWALTTFQTPEAFLWGAVGYKLATTKGGSPPVSQLAGLASLSVLGLAAGGGEMIASFIEDIGEEATKFVASPISTPETDEWFKETGGKVPFHLWKRAKEESNLG